MIWMAGLVLAVLLVEAAIFALFGRQLGLPAADALGMVLPGAALVLALLLTAASCRVATVGAALLAAGIGHVYDLYRRRKAIA